MTDIDFPSLVEQGADAWNQWRAANPTVRPDLSRAYLYNQTLSGFDLRNVNLERACLIGANFQQADLSGACLQAVYASSSDFSGANLTAADLRQGGFSESNFTAANLSAARVQSTEFAGANFTGACLAMWQADGSTSLNDIQGAYLYLQMPPAGRHPRSGQFQPGELAAFLQQRLTPSSPAAAVMAASAVATAAAPDVSSSKTIAALKSLAAGASLEARAIGAVTAKGSGQLWGHLSRWTQQIQRYLLLSIRAFQRDLRREFIPSFRAQCSRLNQSWAEFAKGNSRFQSQLIGWHQRLQISFLQLTGNLQIVAFRQSKRLYQAALVGKKYVRLAIARSRRLIRRSKYLQSVAADLRKEYGRYPVPLAIGAVGAIALIFFSPLVRSERSRLSTFSQVDARPVDSASVEAEATPDERAVPEASRQSTPVQTSSSEPTPPPADTPTDSPSVDSVSLPCPLVQPESSTTDGFTYQDGSVYYGKVVEGQPADGRGTMIYPTGNRYDGEYKDGLRSGCGMFSFSDGRRYVGEFEADRFNGLGTWILENDERYIGEFENNKCSGQGTFIYANGSVKAGEWRDGTMVDGTLSCEWGSLKPSNNIATDAGLNQ